nr:hypothetical protein [Candidatus Njordarchaeota archaeon]
MILIGVDLRDINGAYEFVFKELCPVQILKNIIREHKGIPKPDSLTRDDLYDHITRYIRRNYPRDNFSVRFTELVLESHKKESRDELLRTLGEPEAEANLKPRMKKTLEELGYTPYKDEVKLPPATRADVVAYKRRYDISPRHYEFVGVELKTAKRGKDPLFRQASVYADYFDYSYVAITPLALLEQEYEYNKKFYRDMQDKGVGIILFASFIPLGTILRAKKNRPKESNRKYLTSQLGLVK